MTRLEWLKSRWVAASVTKKYVAVFGFTVLSMATLVAVILFATQLSRQAVGFGFLAVIAIAMVAMTAVAVREGRRYPRVPRRSAPFLRHPAGGSDVSTAQWGKLVDKKLS